LVYIGGLGLERRSHNRAHRSWCGFVVLFTVWAGTYMPAHGQSHQDAMPRYEVFSGVGVTSNSYFSYSGGIWAFGRDVSGAGLRVKALTGYGGYDYDGTLPGFTGSVAFDGRVTLAQFLLGYLWQRGDWTLKAYAGIGFEDHDITPNDLANSVNGNELGFLGQVEVWRNLGEKSWLSADASYGDVFGGYWAQLRLGRRVANRVSVGIEGAALGNDEYDSGRGGGSLRYHLDKIDLTVSGGVSGDYYAQNTGGYATLGFYTKF